MSYYLISDLHFGHQMLINEGIRPHTFEDQIVENTVKALNGGDILIHLGDTLMGSQGKNIYKEFLSRVKSKIGPSGRMVMIRGNHDGKSVNAWMNDGWDWACDGFKLKYAGKNIKFSHRPKQVNPNHTSSINIHGHLHKYDASDSHRSEESIVDDQHKLISLEWLDYHPAKLDSALSCPNFVPVWKGGRVV